MRVAAHPIALRVAIFTALIVLLAFHARAASAEENRSIEIAYLAEGSCPDENAFRSYMETYGLDASAAPTRFFTVLLQDNRALAGSETARGGGKSFAGKVIWVAGVGRTVSRTIAGNTCEGVARALALLVAFAIDTPVEINEPVGAKADPPNGGDRSVPPAPAAPVTQGGGFTVAPFFGRSVSGRSVGIRTLAARNIGGTSVGGTLALQSDDIDCVDGYGVTTVVSGYSGRVGVFSAWGAPWDDSVAGFMLEAGVTGGSARGSVTRTDLSRPWGSTHTASMATQFVNPYAGVSLTFQIPLDWRVRPFAGTSILWTPGFYVGSTFTFDGEVGLRWAAW
jgi:hypothetical protein